MSQINWKERAEHMNFNGQAFINGQRVDALSGATFECISPCDGRKLADVARCDKADVDVAVSVARAAFEDGRWAHLSPRKRKEILIRFADLIVQSKSELALTETLDMGKPISNALAVDVMGAQNTIRWFGEAIDKIYDEVAPTPRDSLALITREPVGVVAAVVPWNYPLLMTSWKIAPALAAGNSVILKPSEKSPLTALRLAELALEAGIPAGVFNVVTGFGHEAGAALAEHMDVDCVAFTGSTAVGKRIMAAAANSNLKRAWMELGGKSPNIVFADCPDMDAAAAAAAGNVFYNQGESCNAPTRLYVEASIKDAFMKKVATYVASFQPGDPLDPATSMGAIVDDIQLNNVLKYIESGKTEGAELIAGGQQCRQESGGYFIEPTIFVTNKDHTIAREEIFGPVLSAMTFETEAEAIALANDSIYGLQAGVWTADISRAHRVARALKAGTVHINQYNDDDITVPFGGYKQSGNGRDKSLHSMDKYCELKTTWIKIDY
ncbi:MAG: puuC [Burkholderiaceae bacterium]|nr:puuC [Burkholderiaceae bacterium]